MPRVISCGNPAEAVFPKDSVNVLPAVSAIRSRELSLLPSHRYYSNVFINKSGSHLLFHTVSSIVPSAVQVLTVVFGMRTGVTPARIATGQIYLKNTIESEIRSRSS